eukprot:1581887-Prymnesium_polylepis.1
MHLFQSGRAAAVVWGILVAVTDEGSTVEQLAAVALLSGVRQRCAEGGEYFFKWDAISYEWCPRGEARRATALSAKKDMAYLVSLLIVRSESLRAGLPSLLRGD